MKKIFLLFAVFMPPVALATDRDYTVEIAETREYIKLLQAEIDQMDSELARCRKQKNTWKTLTIVGGVGVVGTGVGVLVQTNKISKAKKAGATEQTTAPKAAHGDKTE